MTTQLNAALLFALSVTACSRSAEIPTDVRAYLDVAVDSIAANALRRDSVSWPEIRNEAYERAGGATSYAGTYPAIRWVLAALGDDHSFLQLSDSLRELERQASGEPRAAEGSAAEKQPGSPFASRMRPEFELIPNAGRSVGFAFMPQGRRGSRFAREFQRGLSRLAAEHPCGWIVDLRGNGGGDMWPMLAGLGPLIGEGRVGGSVDAAGGGDDWLYREGRAIYRDTSGVERVFAEVPASGTVAPDSLTPVAVLIDRGTGSSGEAMAVAFKGRPNTRFFGERTAGASTATRGIRLEDGANIVLAVSTFANRDGDVYPDGVAPDDVVPSGAELPERERDAGVSAALEWLASSPACSSTIDLAAQSGPTILRPGDEYTLDQIAPDMAGTWLALRRRGDRSWVEEVVVSVDSTTRASTRIRPAAAAGPSPSPAAIRYSC